MSRISRKVAYISALLASTLVVATAHAKLTVHVVAPTPGSFGTTVFYEANAQNPDCANGIHAIRIYSAPHLAAVTVPGNHVETFINLPPGSHNTVVQAWDNCGNVAKQSVAVTTTKVNGVSVFTPSAQPTSPVHVTASAQGACAITAMRIYTAPRVNAYTINSNKLDTFITLRQGTYNMVAQAWDGCGNVYKRAFSVTVAPGSDKYLFAADGGLTEFFIHDGVVTNPNAPNPPPKYTANAGNGFTAVVADPGGNFVYAIGSNIIAGFQIDRATGKLFPMPGSPFSAVTNATRIVAMDPNGHFLYLAHVNPTFLVDYAIDRSTGALTKAAGSFAIPRGDFPLSVGTTSNGEFAYLTTGSLSKMYGFKVNPSNGAFIPVPGNPYSVPAIFAVTVAAGPKYLYVDGTTTGLFGVAGIWGYQIGADGSLTAVPGSPFTPPNEAFEIVQDWAGRSVWTLMCGAGPCLQGFGVTSLTIDKSDGSVESSTAVDTGNSQYSTIVEDHSGQYIYVSGQECGACRDFEPPPPGIVGSFRLSGPGNAVPLSGPLLTGEDFGPSGIAVSP